MYKYTTVLNNVGNIKNLLNHIIYIYLFLSLLNHDIIKKNYFLKKLIKKKYKNYLFIYTIIKSFNIKD